MKKEMKKNKNNKTKKEINKNIYFDRVYERINKMSIKNEKELDLPYLSGNLFVIKRNGKIYYDKNKNNYVLNLLIF